MLECQWKYCVEDKNVVIYANKSFIMPITICILEWQNMTPESLWFGILQRLLFLQYGTLTIFSPLLFVNCTDKFSKWYKITRGMKECSVAHLHINRFKASCVSMEQDLQANSL
jgi:hypothetical protein